MAPVHAFPDLQVQVYIFPQPQRQPLELCCLLCGQSTHNFLMKQIVYSLLFASCSLLAASPKSICLSMTVQNNGDELERTLNSVRPLLDYWVILDAGSQDNTKEIVRRCLKGIPGELHERSAGSPEANDNHALQLARGHGDYTLCLRPNEQWELSNFNKDALDRDYYYIRCKNTLWDRNRLVRSSLPWQWIYSGDGYLSCPSAKTCGALQGAVFTTASPPTRPSPATFGMNTNQPRSVCLNMIVKNEAHVIQRCLNSVKPLIDYWVILDTGSCDGTQAVIRECMKDVPGELFESPFVNFEASRNQAMDLAHGRADYLLFIDADEQLVFEQKIDKSKLDRDFYYFDAHYGGMRYHRNQLINDHIPWRWVGVLHEYLHSPLCQNYGVLEGLYNYILPEGARSKDPKKFHKDAELLEVALKKEPNNTRYAFYLAQSYRDAGEPASSLKWYRKRAQMGGFDQEVFWSKYMIGKLQERLNYAAPIVTKSYIDAFAARPSRIEPLYALASYYRQQNNYFFGYLVTLLGRTIPLSRDSLFVERWMSDYGMELEHSVCCYWLNRYFESYVSSLRLISNPDLPKGVRDTVQNNIGWVKKQLKIENA